MSQATKFIASILDAREATWTENVEYEDEKKRIQEKMKKAFNVNNMINKLPVLNDFKSWNGLVTSTTELQNFLHERSDQQILFFALS